jgi:phosphonoacetate hydrolase
MAVPSEKRLSGAESDALRAKAVGPERAGGQGLDANQRASGDRAILAALTDPAIAAQVDLVITCRDDGYEAWSKRGMVRFCRYYAPDGGYRYEVVEQIGINPIERQAHDALITVATELAAAARSGSPPGDGARAFIKAEELTYPFAYERISQLFDSPDAPDLVIHPACFAAGRQPGQHGCLDVVQSRSPLILSGPGINHGRAESAARQVDIAPTIARLMGFPLIDGRDITGRTATERGVAPDVYLRRQDGRVLEDAITAAPAATPERAYIFLLDGLHNGELLERLAFDDGSITNLRRLVTEGVIFPAGSVTNFPSITWPSHNAIGTGAWCGHHGIVNPNYYDRAAGTPVDPQGRQFETEQHLHPDVETLYEAFHRIYGRWDGRRGGTGAFTAAINEPCNRGAVHASLERRLGGDREQLKAITSELLADISPRWIEDGQDAVQRESVVDTRGVAQAVQLFRDESHPAPAFTFHELVLTDGAAHDYGPHSDGARAALDESDRRIGRVLAALDERGLLKSTLFVVTSDHGMAVQDLSVSGNQAAWLVEHVVAGRAHERFVYLNDLDVCFERADRDLTVVVCANDVDTAGINAPIVNAGAFVRLNGVTVSGATSGEDGRIDLGEVPDGAEVFVTADRYNSRLFRADGTEPLPILAGSLYGARLGEPAPAT